MRGVDYVQVHVSMYLSHILLKKPLVIKPEGLTVV